MLTNRTLARINNRPRKISRLPLLALVGGTLILVALLQGRRSYQVSAQAWPRRCGDAFSVWINSVQKYVVSDMLSETDITWQPTTIIRSADLRKKVSELRDQPGGYIYVYGSATMVRALLAADLVDELPHDRADRSRRRQDDLPRQPGGADIRARFDGQGEDRGASLPLPPRPLTHHIGGVSPGTEEGARRIAIPSPTIASASGKSMAVLGGRTFWARTRTVITDIQMTLMKPSATSITISPMLEPTQ